MTSTFGTYKRVLMLGIDGMGAFNKYANTPNMDKLFANGAMTYNAMAAYPTISSVNWPCMLIGAIPEVHKQEHGMHPIPELPTVFGHIKKAFPDADTAAFTDWSPIAMEIISPDGGAGFLDVGEEDGLCERILKYLDDHDPKLLFIQFDGVDGAGHRDGYGSQHHLDEISHNDELLGKLLAKYDERGFTEDTLFIVTADHGGTVGGSHGSWTDVERFVFLGVAGKNVKKGQIDDVHIRDFPAIVLHALGIEAPAFDPDSFAAQMPTGIFEDAGVTERKELYPTMTVDKCKIDKQPEKDSPEYIGNFIDEDRIMFWQTFENGVEDVTGKCKVTTERGLIKTYNNGLIGKSGEFGNGVLKIEGIKHSDVFTFSFWFYTTGDTRWLDLFSNKKEGEKSFTIAPYGVKSGIYLKDTDLAPLERMEVLADHYEESITNCWTHFMFEVNTKTNEISCFVNFKKKDEFVFYEKVYDVVELAPHFNMETTYMALDQHMGQLFYKIVDDVMIIDGPAPVEELEKYYKG